MSRSSWVFVSGVACVMVKVIPLSFFSLFIHHSSLVHALYPKSECMQYFVSKYSITLSKRNPVSWFQPLVLSSEPGKLSDSVHVAQVRVSNLSTRKGSRILLHPSEFARAVFLNNFSTFKITPSHVWVCLGCVPRVSMHGEFMHAGSGIQELLLLFVWWPASFRHQMFSFMAPSNRFST